MADSPIVHAVPPIEELPVPALNPGWSQPSQDAPLRIFRQGKRVFFTGELICGTNAGSKPFASPLPEGWRPAGQEWFPCLTPKGVCGFLVKPSGEVEWGIGAWELGRGSWFTLNTISYLAEN